MNHDRIALLWGASAIGAADILRQFRLQIICGSAMGKQDRPKRVKTPCARLEIATAPYPIGDRMVVRISEVCKEHIIARPGVERDEKDTHQRAWCTQMCSLAISLVRSQTGKCARYAHIC